MQLVGFHDAGAALLLELCEGGPPEPDNTLLASVKLFLKQVEKMSCIEVGDIKLGNLVMDGRGVARVVDFGQCCYTGGATCEICGEDLDTGIEEHASFHMKEYMQKRRVRGAPSRLRLHEFCYGSAFC